MSREPWQADGADVDVLQSESPMEDPAEAVAVAEAAPPGSTNPLVLLPGERKAVGLELLVALLVVGLPDIVFGLWSIAQTGDTGPVEPRTLEDTGWRLVFSAGPISLLLFLAWRDRLGFALVGAKPFLRPFDLAWSTLAFGVMVGAAMLARKLALEWSLYSWMTDHRAIDSDPAVAALAPVHFLVGAIAEELFYRAYLWTRLTQLSGNANVSWVACAVGFAVAHGYSPAESLEVLFLGLSLGALYRWTRRLPGLVAGHAAYNLFITIS